jgi:hypothetical protein
MGVGIVVIDQALQSSEDLLFGVDAVERLTAPELPLRICFECDSRYDSEVVGATA